MSFSTRSSSSARPGMIKAYCHQLAASCALAAALLCAALSGSVARAAPAAAPVAGGSINVAMVGEPPTLDPMTSSTELVGIITQHVFETLYTYGEHWEIVPLLASELPTISKDGKTFTIPLRTNVKFHNGAPMKADDVVASLKRWMQIAARGKQVAQQVESVGVANHGTAVQFKLHNYYAPLLFMLAFNTSAAVIMPANKLAPVLTEYVGTGPYRLKDRQPDRYIQLARFDGYAARTEAPNLFGGKRTAYLDEIRFVPVPNANTRVEGASSGQFDFADALPVESFPRFAGNRKTELLLSKPYGPLLMTFNTKQGALADPALRRAVQASLNTSDMMEAAFGSTMFFQVNGSLYPPGYAFHNTKGVENYNLGNSAKAKAMAKAAGYQGREIRILVSSQFDFHIKMAQVAAEYMKLAGFRVKLEVSDWATLTTRRNDPGKWEIFFTHSAFFPEPAIYSMMNDNAPGWWSTPEKSAVLTALNRERSDAGRALIFGDFQQLVYQQVPVIKVGDFNVVTAKARNLRGYRVTTWPFFWNVWKEAR
jgi:peptide/nickel transport system substrate-binding protein